MTLPKVKLLERLVESGVIPVIRKLPEDVVEDAAASLVEGGVRALEVTVDSPGAFSLIERLSKRFEGQAIVGAGTVLDSESARLAIAHGASFVLSPSLHQDVIRTCLRYGKAVIPGVMTPTEMIQAVEGGADIVKIFPANQLGAKYIKSVQDPLPQVPILPTGGINIDNAGEFIRAGAVAVGAGGSLLDKQMLAEKDFKGLEAHASRFVQAVRDARSS